MSLETMSGKKREKGMLEYPSDTERGRMMQRERTPPREKAAAKDLEI